MIQNSSSLSLEDYFSKHPLINPKVFLGNTPFNTILPTKMEFSAVLIPLLFHKTRKHKSNLGNVLPAFKFVCLKMQWVYDKTTQKTYRKCFYNIPDTSSKCGRMVYIYPEKTSCISQYYPENQRMRQNL